MPTLRQQTCPYFQDFHVDFMEAFLATWNAQGIDAARCFALGA